jgi:hypothetical protein
MTLRGATRSCESPDPHPKMRGKAGPGRRSCRAPETGLALLLGWLSMRGLADHRLQRVLGREGAIRYGDLIAGNVPAVADGV